MASANCNQSKEFMCSIILEKHNKSLYAADEPFFAAIFEEFNEVRKAADLKALTSLMTRAQVHGINECINNDICGKHLEKNLKLDALLSYTVIDYVRFDANGKVVRHRNKDHVIEYISGPAAQLYYQGRKSRGDKGEGIMTFGIEDGEWKISMMSWNKTE
jgi:hypothetical protein